MVDVRGSQVDQSVSEGAGRPLRALWRHHRRYRPRVVAAVAATTLNTAADVAPELLIGVAVDIVVRGATPSPPASSGSRPLRPAGGGRDPQRRRLGGRVGLDYLPTCCGAGWPSRSSTTCGSTPTRTCRISTSPGTRVRLPAGCWRDQRRRQPARTLPRRRRPSHPAHVLDGRLRGCRVRRHLVAADAVRVPPGAGHRGRLHPLPAPPRAALQRRPRPAGRTVARPSRPTSAGSPPSRPSPPSSGRSNASAGVSDAYREANRRAIRSSAAFVPLIRMAILAGFTSTLLLGGWLVLEGQLEIGLYTVLVFMTQRLLWPLTDLGETLDLYQRAMASTRRIFTLMAERGQQQPGPSTLPGPVRGGSSSATSGSVTPTVPTCCAGSNLVVPAGETHAVVGATGAGKSSVLRLRPALLRPPRRLGAAGRDRRPRADLGRSARVIGYVSQDVFLFHGTVRDNIAYGRPGATDAEVREAARLAEASRFIEAYPGRLRHGGRGARPHALGRATAADRPGPGDSARSCRPRARRGHVRGRQRDRGRHPALPGPRHRRPDRVDRRPPAVDRPRCRPDLGPRRRSGGGVGHPRRAGGQTRPLRQPLGRPDRSRRASPCCETEREWGVRSAGRGISRRSGIFLTGTERIAASCGMPTCGSERSGVRSRSTRTTHEWSAIAWTTKVPG